MATIVRFVETFTNGALRAPVAYSVLACGHAVGLRLRAPVATCCACGVKRDHPFDGTQRACACGAYRDTIDFPNPHIVADRLDKIGDDVECARCAHYAVALAGLRALDWSTISHTRYRPAGDGGAIFVYRHDERSPSGVVLAMTIDSTPESEAICAQRGAAPLSPTEDLRGAR